MATFNIITLGCSKNTVDSEVIASKLISSGHKVVFESTQNSDFVIVNTCSFIRDSKEQSIDEIFLHLQRKKKGDIKKVFVVGCLSERYHDELLEMIPEADGVFAFSEIKNLMEDESFDLLKSPNRLLSTPNHYAYMKVSEGCDRECSFCAIPSIRGKQISKPVEMLVEEAEKLAQNGVKELMLIAQDLTYYGMDLYKKRDLERLLRKLGQVKGLEWIRLHYAYPLGFPYEILDVMNEYSTFCKYLDIPLQHISDEVLKSMRRGGNSMQTYKLVETIRNKVPGIAIRTTLISGYPNETRKEHKELVDFVREMRFERLGVFAYSPEEGTPAFPLGDPIKQREKNKRVEEIMLLQEQISLEHNQKKVGTTMKVIIDAKEGQNYLGRTEFDSPDVDNGVIISSKKKIEIGTFQTVYITKADNYDLFGDII
ncbi:MAG: 30S ribosomal protein S12 methylthiotransferase RimO [Bacteroidetes bacterium HGW-Bacteroidetes-19]|nr:MAG: 30S ribosomal protein S12 methylthiotransferase RimO [Bacteroidetes bacterium HGW-Bacteroidetes-19]